MMNPNSQAVKIREDLGVLGKLTDEVVVKWLTTGAVLVKASTTDWLRFPDQSQLRVQRMVCRRLAKKGIVRERQRAKVEGLDGVHTIWELVAA